METLFSAVILLLLLLFLRQAIPSLHPLFVVIFFFVFFQFAFFQTLVPFLRHFIGLVQHVPYAIQLIYSAALFILSELLYTLLSENEYEAIGEVLQLVIRITLLMYWIVELEPVFQTLSTLLKKVQ